MLFNKFRLMTCCFLICYGSSTVAAYAAEQDQRFPAPNPPSHLQEGNDVNLQYTESRQVDTPKEWTFHKTADGTHPNGMEQQILWFMNRARMYPTSEGKWLAHSNDPEIAKDRSYFQVDINKLKNEFAAIPVKPPAAFDNRLYAAAHAHSLDLISRDAQDHDGQVKRIDAAGFHFRAVGLNVFSYASSGLNAHAGWNIDWGYGDGGMQTGRGHRKNVMSTMFTDHGFSSAGIAAIRETDPSTKVGEYVATGNYAKADTAFDNNFNKFVVGTIWNDFNQNKQYDPGEGVGGFEVYTLYGKGSYYAITGKNGGYSIPVSDDGTYTIGFCGSSSYPACWTVDRTVRGKSVLADLELSTWYPAPEIKIPLPAIMLLLD